MTPYFKDKQRNFIKGYGKQRIYLRLSRNRFLRRIYKNIKTLMSFEMKKRLGSTEELIIMGRPVMSKEVWGERKKLENKQRRQSIPNYFPDSPKNESAKLPQQGAGNSQLGVIASIYRPGDLLSVFLGNLEEQSIFELTQVVLVLVDPKSSEIEMIDSFCEKYGNVKLVIFEQRLTIYEAWNVAIRLTNTSFLTNMNIDDLRSPDSLEIQLQFMLDRPWADVGYQDFYYMWDRDLDWTSVVNVGALSELPPVTLLELAWFGVNPPHNAPVWRRELHERFGEFDGNLRSAGDYEFWLRVCSKGASFVKIPISTVGYYINPKGMSTSSESPSVYEEKILQEKYRDLIETSSSTIPNLKLKDRFASAPWDAAEILTEKVLDELKEVSE